MTTKTAMASYRRSADKISQAIADLQAGRTPLGKLTETSSAISATIRKLDARVRSNSWISADRQARDEANEITSQLRRDLDTARELGQLASTVKAEYLSTPQYPSVTDWRNTLRIREDPGGFGPREALSEGW